MTGLPIPEGLWGRYEAKYRPLHPPRALGDAGGISGGSLWHVSSPDGPLMLRAWPEPGPGRPRIDQVHRWLLGLKRLSWVAAPLGDRSGMTVQELAGRFWELARFHPGRADLDRPPGRTHLAAMFGALAEVHGELAHLTSLGPSPGLRVRADELHRLAGFELAEFDRVLRSSPDDETRHLAARWLALAGPAAPVVAPRVEGLAGETWNLQPVIRDVRPDHFLFDGDELTGLVDFGAMGVDTVATDLARLLGETAGRGEQARGVALDAYDAIRPISPRERAAIEVFEAANAVLGGARWVRWHFVDRRQFADPGAVQAGFRRTLDRLETSRLGPD